MKGRHVILGLLMKKKRSGYDINEMLKTVFFLFYDGSFGMIYTKLRKLEKEGKIEKEVIIQEGKPNKNVFSITQKGVQEFNEFLRSPVKEDSFQSDFLARMYFGEYAEHDQMIDWIRDEIERKTAFISQLEKDFVEWKPELTATQKISLDVGLAIYKAQVKVLNEKLDSLDGERER